MRVGVIGLGAFGEFQIQAFKGMPGVEVSAVASRSADRAREVAGRYGIPRWYASYESLCDDPEIDAVTIATEESQHVAPTLTALAAGKHVLVEKPLASNRADAMAILAAAQEARGTLMPGHIVRFESRFLALKQAIAGGELGAIAAIHASRNRPRSTLATYGRCHPALVTAIHDLDAMMWLLGERPVSVRARHRLETGVDGVYGIWGTLVFPGGAIATIEATWMMPDETGLENGDVFSVTGTRGVGNIDMGSSGMRLLTTGRSTVPETGYQPWSHDGIGGALLAELNHFLLLAKDLQRTPVVTVLDGVNAVIAAEAMIASATEGREIEIAWPI